MDTLGPEQRERSELYREKREFSPLMEKQILERMGKGKERFPDIITCPKRSCRSPIKVNVEVEHVDLVCPLCGWKKRIYKQTQDT